MNKPAHLRCAPAARIAAPSDVLWRSSARVRRRAGATVAVLGATFAVAFATPAAVTAKSCRKATIGGRSVCIAAGQVCNRKYAGQYLRYGLSCARSSRKGPYRLLRTPPRLYF